MNVPLGKSISTKSIQCLSVLVWVLLLKLSLFSGPIAASNISTSVVASIKPVQLLINEVTGRSNGKVDNGQITELLLRNNQSHHLKTLKPSQRRLVSEAKYVFYISDEFESYMQAVKRADESVNSVFKYIELGKLPDIRLLTVRQDAEMPQSYERGHELGHAATGHDGHQGHHLSGPDWHIWLNPDNAIVMMAKIRDVLIEMNPEYRTQYQLNYQNAVIRITSQSKRIAEKMMEVMKIPFITLHDGYQYFEEQYGLYSLGSVLRHDEGASAKRLVEMRELIVSHDVRCVFKEAQYSDRVLRPVIDGFKIDIVDLDSLGQRQSADLDSYTDFVERFAGTLYRSLIRDRLMTGPGLH